MVEEQSSGADRTLLQDVEQMLRLQDASSMGGSMGLLLTGLGICIGVGLALAAVISLLFALLFGTTLIGFRGWFWLYVIALVGFAYLYERKSAAGTSASATPGLDATSAASGPPKLDAMLSHPATRRLMWAPHAVVEGFWALRGQRPPQQQAVFDRATLLVVDLSKSMGGIEIKRLVHPPEDMEIFGKAVDMLQMHSWIGRATDGKSLWLNSTFRERLRVARSGKSAPV